MDNKIRSEKVKENRPWLRAEQIERRNIKNLIITPGPAKNSLLRMGCLSPGCPDALSPFCRDLGKRLCLPVSPLGWFMKNINLWLSK